MPLPNPPYNGLVTIGEEDVSQGTVRKINFTGVGVTATVAAGQAEIDIPGASGAPADAEYLVGALSGGLSAERLVTDTATNAWDLTTPGQAKVNVPDASITYPKIQDVSAASKLLGRGDSGAGDVQEITLGTNLSITGTTLNASGGGGSASFTAATITIPYGVQRAVVNVVDAAITALSKIQVLFGMLADTDENSPEMDEVSFSPTALAGSMNVLVSSQKFIGGTYKVIYLLG